MQSLLRLQREKASVWIAKAQKLFESGDYDRVIGYTAKAIFLVPSHYEAYAYRAEAFIRLGDFKSGIANYVKAISVLDEEANHSLNFEEQRQKYINKLKKAFLVQGQLCFEDQNFVQAKHYFSKAIELDDTNVHFKLRRAYTNYLTGDLVPALAEVNECIKLDRSNPDIYCFRAEIQWCLSNWLATKRDAETALTHHPFHKHAKALLDKVHSLAGELVNKATNQCNEGEYDRALANLNEAIQLSSDPDTLLNFAVRRAAVFRHQGAFPEALHELRNALIRHHRLPPEGLRLLAMTFNELGAAYYMQRNLDDALTCFNKAIRVDSTCAIFYINRGDCHRAARRPLLALADYHTAAELEPKWLSLPHVLSDRLALLHAEIGQRAMLEGAFGPALVELTHAIKLSPSTAVYYVHRAKCQLALQRYDAAREDIFTAASLDPNSTEAQLLVAQVTPATVPMAPLAPLPPVK